MATFALKARALADPEAFDGWLGRLEAPRAAAIRAAIAACDRIEQEIRDERVMNGYHCWRERVTEWLSAELIYPFVAVGESLPRPHDAALTHS